YTIIQPYILQKRHYRYFTFPLSSVTALTISVCDRSVLDNRSQTEMVRAVTDEGGGKENTGNAAFAD
ncbi:MAG TPA: hypothetical protein VKR06_37795, partial [Ktedonosporobacter sp.]|nr:hypothetical protein [Ktedonosporobacter sp.]